MSNTIAVEVIATRILEIRGKKVMLDADLAKLYGVSTKRLNEQVRRNKRRFPGDFMYRLTWQEIANLRSQFATSSSRSQNVTMDSRSQFATLKQGKNIKYQPYVFTEQGIAMLSSVLNSDRAIRVNIQIMRAFVQIRKMLLTNADLRRKIEEMEKKYDSNFAIVFEAIKRLLEPPKQTRAIGFRV